MKPLKASEYPWPTESRTAPPLSVAPCSASDGACQATPREELLRQLLDSRIPKNEREWCAAREIERLRGEVAQLEKNCTQIYDVMKKVEAESKFFQTLVQSHRSLSLPNKQV